MDGQRRNYVKRIRTHEDYVDNGRSKRRNSFEMRAPSTVRTKDSTTVYRYLCPGRKVGHIIGRGGDTVKQLRAQTEANIDVGKSKPGCEDRIVTIWSSHDEKDDVEDMSDYVCSAQDALFRIHEKVVVGEAHGDEDLDVGELQVSVRLLVPYDQIGHIIGKNGQTIHCIRNDTEAHIRVWKDEDLPTCANRTDNLIEITGEARAVKKALFQVSTLLYRHPSSIQNLSCDISHAHMQDDTVYRYLCPERSIGSIIGRGGEIVTQLRAETQAKITIGKKVRGYKERIVTILSSREKTNLFGGMGDYICPAQDALFRLHERLISNEPSGDEDVDGGGSQATIRLVVPGDQIGHIIGKCGHIIQEIRGNSGATIQITKDEQLPPCSDSGDELLQITGQAPRVMDALVQVSSYLRDRPSRSQCLLFSSDSHAQLQRGTARECSSSHPENGECSSKRFVLCLVCPAANVARVIGKDGNNIDKIRQQSGASIRVDSSTKEDCIISISGKESSENPVPSAINAAVLLQPRCSEMSKRAYGEPLYTTRLLVPESQIGCLIGKGGYIITEIRRDTQANIRIMKESLPKVAAADDVLVQISGEVDASRKALIQISEHLTEYFFK